MNKEQAKNAWLSGQVERAVRAGRLAYRRGKVDPKRDPTLKMLVDSVAKEDPTVVSSVISGYKWGAEGEEKGW